MCLTKKTLVQTIREIATKTQTGKENYNELHLLGVNCKVITLTAKPDLEDNSPEDPKATKKHSLKSKEAVPDSKRKQQKRKKKWLKWTPKMIDNLVKCSSNIRSHYELKGFNFESHYVALYTETREAMSALYNEGNFDPPRLTEMRYDVDPNKCNALITDPNTPQKLD